MLQCQNCGYTDESGDTFEEEDDPETGETIRYCPECGSDEVFPMEESESGDLDEEWSGEEEAERW